jgi:hypothetical protein
LATSRRNPTPARKLLALRGRHLPRAIMGHCGLAARRLFAKKFALTGNSLVKLGDFLDPVFKLAVPLGQLPSYHIATTGRTPIHEVCSESDFLTGQKLVLCRSTAFRAHAWILTHCKVFAATSYSNDAGYDSKKLSASSVAPTGGRMLWRPMHDWARNQKAAL